MVRIVSTILILACVVVGYVYPRDLPTGMTECEVTSAKLNVTDCTDLVDFIGYWGTAYLAPGGPCWEIGNGTCGARMCNVKQGGNGAVNLAFEQAAIREGVFRQCILREHYGMTVSKLGIATQLYYEISPP